MKKLNTKGVMRAVTVSFLFVVAVPLAAFAASPASVNLGTAGNYAILSKTGVSTTGATSVIGDIGVSPVQATYITGFALTLPAASAFSTSAMVTGKVYAPGYADPTPANLITAVLDMQNAYTDAAGRAPDVTELGAGNIGGMTLVPGVYKWSTGVTIPTDVTLSGGVSDVWIFEVAQNLDLSSATRIVLSGGAQAANIFWVVAGQTTIGTTAVFNGNILDQTAIVLNTGAQLNGRALAQTAVTLDSNTVTMPSGGGYVAPTPVVVPTPTPTPAPTPVTTTYTPPVTTVVPGMSTTQAAPVVQPSGLSAEKIQAILNLIGSFNVDAATMAKVELSLRGTTNGNGAVTSTAVAAFKSSLTVGSLGSDVKLLQQYLNAHGYAVATSGAGSLGNETTKFGAATRAALIKYQKAHNITPAVGYFGAVTRAAVNAGQ